jgi:hypothetical protein
MRFLIGRNLVEERGAPRKNSSTRTVNLGIGDLRLRVEFVNLEGEGPPVSFEAARIKDIGTFGCPGPR